MRQVFEFRVSEEYAPKLFRNEEGKRLGTSVRKIELSGDDPRLREVCALNVELRKSNKRFFAGWDIHRHYESEELQRAELFRIHHLATFEPAGEERGTQYDERTACTLCRSGARQTSSLYLDPRSIPRGKDICRTIGNEIVVSSRLVSLFAEHNVTGVKFCPVMCHPKSSAISKDWHQLVLTSKNLRVTHPTVIGINPCDEDVKGEYRCPRGDCIGLAPLSEVWLLGSDYDGADIVCSEQFVGLRRGLLRPEKLMFVSQKVRNLMLKHSAKGCRMDVAYFAK